MAEKVSAGQRDKAAVEATTAAVGAANERDDKARRRESRPTAGQDAAPATSAERDEVREQLAQADSAADKFQQAQDVDTDLAGEVALNPYPAYEDKPVGELKSAADGRGVEINRDVEKSELVRLLRDKDPQNAAGLDFTPLEALRSLAAQKGVELGDEFVKAHLVTELRAADTGVNNPGDHVL